MGANRSAHTIRAFDARTGEVVSTVAMAAGSQPGDLAYAWGKLYVAEEFGTPPAIAIVDAETGVVTKRIAMAAGSRPHHVHASANGKLVAFGLYGTDMVAVVDTRTDTPLGPWDTNPAPGATSGRAHAGVFAPNGRTLYVASDATNEVIAIDPRTGEVFWRMNVPGAHELVVARNGKTAYVSRRTANRLSVIDLRSQTYTDVVELALPDTLQLSSNRKLLTVGLRTTPAQVAVVDTRTFQYELVRIGPVLDTNTIAGHQWTSRNGRFTFAAYEGGTSPGVAVIDHRAGNQVVQTLAYPGRPHGVDLARGEDADEEDEEED
jgi:outer membrane protein assembly factor BamB